ncbi:hypothetical protein Ahy_B03g065792 [Arachis hypogaea]|uniref:Ribosome-recycling factor, chloroplastic n=1 Tax=Arachis hypogaea TaxID=3818 RepID=A0A445A2D9_ARAHY|nr:hypothetical protein Ahy_B03g065792 [Arachis hypogaea]
MHYLYDELDINVEYYGSPVSLKSIAQISTPDASSLLVQPYDKSSLKGIEKAIVSSDVGMTPNNDGEVIRLTLPQLTSERRKIDADLDQGGGGGSSSTFYAAPLAFSGPSSGNEGDDINDANLQQVIEDFDD